MTLDEHIQELEAELSWNDNPVECRQIRQELEACLKRVAGSDLGPTEAGREVEI